MQQTSNGLQHHHIIRAIEAPSARPLHRDNEIELRLPEAQNMLRRADFFGGFGDRAEGAGAFGQ